MHVIFQLAVCVCLIILAGGSIHYVHDNPSFGGGIMLLMIWGILIGLIETTKMFKFGRSIKSNSNGDASTERITHLEKRLSDIQEIVITIDEKLSRVERQADTPVEDAEKVE